MESDDSEGLLNEIGQLLMSDSEYASKNTLLYAELDRNMVGESIFKELGNQVLYRHPTNERLPYALLDLWETQEGNDRWMELEYLLRDGRFEVVYIYPNEIDPDERFMDRRERSVRRHFGEKPIVFPPLLSDDDPSYDL